MAKDIGKRTLRDLERIVCRRWLLFSLTASLVALACLVAAHWALPVKYTATTVFERTTDASSQEQARNSLESAAAIQLTMKQDLMGPKAVAQAVEDLGLTREFPREQGTVMGRLTTAGEARKQELVLKLIGSIRVTSIESPAVDRVSVSFTDADPRLVQQLPDTLVHNYIIRMSKQIESGLTESRDFFAKQVNAAKNATKEFTANRIKFETEHAGQVPEDPRAIQDTLQRIETDIDTVRRKHAEDQLKLARLKGMVEARDKARQGSAAEPFQTVKGPNPELQRLKEQRDQAKEQLDSARTLSHMTEKHPMVVTLRAKVADLEARIKETPEEAVLQTVYGQGPGTSSVDDLDVQMVAAKSSVEVTTGELARLQQQQSLYQKLLANFGPVRQKYLELTADLMDQEAKRKEWETRLSVAERALAAQVADNQTRLEQVQAALPQYKPSDPKLAYVLVGSLVIGLTIAGALVFLSNAWDRAVRTTEDAVEGFGLPVFGVIDVIVTRQERFKRGLLRWTIGPVLSVVILIALGLGSLSVVLWLEYPEELGKWKAAPLAYLRVKAADKAAETWNWLEGRAM